MFKNQIKFNVLIAFCLALFFASCTKEESDVEVENYGITEAYEIQKSLKCGIHGCVELVFPISVTMPDSTVLVFDSFEDGKDQLQAWREANPDIEGRPRIIFPVEIITEDGELVSLENFGELKEQIASCKPDFPRRPRHFKACFTLQYPVGIAFPDGSELEVNSRQEFKQELREWKKENPDAEERPELIFPIIIVYEDGSEQEIASREGLRDAKKACRE